MVANPVLVLVGPTCVGKTELSLKLAPSLNAEIVSADSRQIYKFLDIGTAKPSKVEFQKVRHHFINVLEPDQDYSAGEYSHNARQKIKFIQNTGKNVIVVGGSGLYLKALLYGIIAENGKDEIIRSALKERLDKEGLSSLYKELNNLDPELAKRLSPNDTQRILRGLEVFFSSGNRLSAIQGNQEDVAPFEYVQIGLTMDRKLLYERINKRVDDMLVQGLIDEVKYLKEQGWAKNNSLNTVGYKEVLQYLDGEIDFDMMTELIKRNTRRYAKRQLTWFRKDQTISWFDTPLANLELKIQSLLQKVQS